MNKILSFSLYLISGLVVSQFLPSFSGEHYHLIKAASSILLYICLGFIMINVGREFTIDKTRWKSYAVDYFIAMLTAALPWLLVAVYYVIVLLPSVHWYSWEVWKEKLLLSRFAAPTSAGILFTMLAAIGLKSSWIYKKIQVLAIFDDLDTILLMIPLQIMMIGMKWQLIVVVLVVFILLSIGWKRLGKYDMRQDWKAILLYSAVIFLITQTVYIISKTVYGEDSSIHIEVLLPAFVLGMVMKHKEIHSKTEQKVSSFISFLFMFLVGVSMPCFLDLGVSAYEEAPKSFTAAQPMMEWELIAVHVFIVSLLSNIGKICPVMFYRDRKLSERLALSIGMFTRGEVGAGIIFIGISYNLGGPVLVISVLTLVLNLILTGVFVVWVKRLAMMSYEKKYYTNPLQSIKKGA